MSVLISEVMEWLGNFDPNGEVYVDEGGLTLCIHGTEAYMEVGWEPERWEEFAVEVHRGDTLFDEVPTCAIIQIPEELINRILDMRKAVIDGNLYCAEVWDCTPDYRVWKTEEDPPEKWEEYDGRIEVQRLRVTDKEFQWVGVIRHTTVEVETQPIDISELEN